MPSPTTPEQIKILARTLMQQHKAVVLEYTGKYDSIKYNLVCPVTEVQFDTHRYKWQFIELAKSIHDKKSIDLSSFPIYLNMIYGEGYRAPDMLDMSAISQLHQGGALGEIFAGYLSENKQRYQILEASLTKMRLRHDIHELSEFKEFISPIITPKGQIIEPPMWVSAIGYSPIQRANRSYSLSLESFFLLDSAIHLLDKWDARLVGEPEWDSHVKRLRTYRKLYSYMFPINSMLVRQAINSTMNFTIKRK
jgi:hypothetical protein